MSAPFPHFPIRWFSRTIPVEGRGVRMKMIYQFGQWYALADDHAGAERVGVGDTRIAATESLAKLLRAIKRYDEQGKRP